LLIRKGSLRPIDADRLCHFAYDNREFGTQDAAILFDALELMAARRTKFALRLRPENRNNGGRARRRRLFLAPGHRRTEAENGPGTTIINTNPVYKIGADGRR
jgi:hypothetical protein